MKARAVVERGRRACLLHDSGSELRLGQEKEKKKVRKQSME